MKQLLLFISVVLTSLSLCSLSLQAKEQPLGNERPVMGQIDNNLEKIVGPAVCQTECRLSGIDFDLELKLSELLSELLESDNDPEVQRKVMQFLTMNKKYFTSNQRANLSQQLLRAKSPNDLNALMMCEFKNPGTAWVLNFFLGFLGVDKFYLGKAGAGVIKLLTVGGLGIWWFLDLFLISSATKKINYNEALSAAMLL